MSKWHWQKEKFWIPCQPGPLSSSLATVKMTLIFRQERETARKLHTKLVSLQVSCTAHWCRETWPIMKSFAFICRPGCVDISPDSGSCCFTESKEICTWKPHPHYLTLQLAQDCFLLDQSKSKSMIKSSETLFYFVWISTRLDKGWAYSTQI